MTEREIVRRNGCPVAFKTQSIQYIEVGKKEEPQEYTPNKKSCKKHEHKHKHHHHKHHKHAIPTPPPPPPPPITYKCDGMGNCNPVTDGTGYATLDECLFNCRPA